MTSSVEEGTSGTEMRRSRLSLARGQHGARRGPNARDGSGPYNLGDRAPVLSNLTHASSPGADLGESPAPASFGRHPTQRYPFRTCHATSESGLYRRPVADTPFSISPLAVRGGRSYRLRRRGASRWTTPRRRRRPRRAPPRPRRAPPRRRPHRAPPRPRRAPPRPRRAPRGTQSAGRPLARSARAGTQGAGSSHDVYKFNDKAAYDACDFGSVTLLGDTCDSPRTYVMTAKAASTASCWQATRTPKSRPCFGCWPSEKGGGY